MEKIYKKARAKINLTLNILNKREDGYHNLETIFQKVSLYDEIYVSKAKNHNEIKIETNITNLYLEDNIIFKAYKVLKNRFSNISGVDVILKKNIPMQAGLAGGSTDCASFIECMNELFSLKMTRKEMVTIGASLGADVPQALYNTPIIARGIGEIIEEIKSNSKYYILIIKPDILCNTKEMFKKIDNRKCIEQKYNTQAVKKAIEEGNIDNIAKNLYNVFETEVDNVEQIKSELIKVGALGSLMTGSGSAVYGIFKDKELAKKAYRTLNNKYNTYYCISYMNKEKVDK